MKYLKDNCINASISRIGLGTSRMGSLYNEELSFDLLDLFYESGGTVLDTARNYYEWTESGRGKSERCVGKWMHQRNNRSEMCIITKGGTSGKGSKKINLSRNVLLEELQESLDALETDYIDIYLLHKDEKNRSIEEIVETIQILKEKYKIEKVGVDDWSLERLIDANKYAEKHGYTPFTVIESWWSLAEYTNEFWNNPDTYYLDKNILSYIKNKEYYAISASPQCKGFFQKFIEDGEEKVDKLLLSRIGTERNKNKALYIKKYCDEHRVKPTAFILGYITSQKTKSIAIVGCSNVEQLDEIINFSDYQLTEGTITEIDSI